MITLLAKKQDELEDHEEDEREYEYENNNEKNYSDITLTSFVPSIDIHIENYNEILFTPTFLTEINHPIDSNFIGGVQDFKEYAQTINSGVVQSNLINNFIRYDNFELPALESNMIRSHIFEIQACESDMVRSDTFDIPASESIVERPESDFFINQNFKSNY